MILFHVCWEPNRGQCRCTVNNSHCHITFIIIPIMFKLSSKWSVIAKCILWRSTKHQECKFTQIYMFYIFHFDHLCDIQAGIMEKYLWNWCPKTLWLNKTRPRRIIRRAELSQNQEGYETIMHVQSQFTPNTKPFELCMLIVLLWLINYLIHYSYSLCSLLLNSNCAENGISVFHSLIKVPTSQLFITKSMLHVWKYEHLNIPLQIFVNSQSTREINIFEVDPF